MGRSAVDLALEAILPSPDLGEDLGWRLAGHPDICRKIGGIGAQKRIGHLFVADGDGYGRFAFRQLFVHLRGACFERRIALPTGRYNQITKDSLDGCLLIQLRKAF